MSADIRVLNRTEMPLCQDLAQARKWGREDRKWELLFEVGIVYGIDAPDGDGLAAMAVATRYGTTATAISMVVTAERYERQGISGRLMRHIMDNAGTASCFLTATEYGRPLYERLGFRTDGFVAAHFGAPELTSTGLSRPATEADLDAIAALDEEAFGAPRREVLATLMGGLGLGFRIVEGPQGPVGFGGAWRYEDRTLIGPVAADRPETAITLLTDLIATTPGPHRLEMGDWQPGVAAWAGRVGFEKAFTVTAMEYGEPLKGNRSHFFSTIALALG